MDKTLIPDRKVVIEYAKFAQGQPARTFSEAPDHDSPLQYQPRSVHGPNGQVTLFMERFRFRCIERVLPPLDLLVQVAGLRTGFS